MSPTVDQMSFKQKPCVTFFFCALLLAYSTGCSLFKPQQATPPAQENLIGRPPTPEQDDPLFARALPAEAIPAEPSGRIGTDAPKETDAQGPVPKEEPSLAASHSIEPPLTGPEVEPEIAPELEPKAERQPPACFSCVQICPLDQRGRPNCQDRADDLICGWGSHPDADIARETAKIHCDATLDMARQLPNYSDISGSCPIATCK